MFGMFGTTILARFAWPLAGVALAVAAVGAQELRVRGLQRDLAQERQSRADDRAVMERTALRAVEAARSEEQRRTTALKGVLDEADKNTALARADAASANAAAAGLRQRATVIAAGCGRVPQGPATPTSGPADRLADVLAESVDRYRTVAEASDRAIIAGNACSAAYGSLTVE